MTLQFLSHYEEKKIILVMEVIEDDQAVSVTPVKTEFVG